MDAIPTVQIDLDAQIRVVLNMTPDRKPHLKQIIEAWINTDEAKGEGVVGCKILEGPNLRASVIIRPKMVTHDGAINCNLTKFINYACFIWQPK